MKAMFVLFFLSNGIKPTEAPAERVATHQFNSSNHRGLKTTNFMTFFAKNQVQRILLPARSLYDAILRTDTPSTNSHHFSRSSLEVLVAKVQSGSSIDEILPSLLQDHVCSSIHVSHDLVVKLLRRFNGDWKSALAIFKWAESCPSYEPLPESYDMVVDILGKNKQIEKMKLFLDEMRQNDLVTLTTIAKVFRRLAGSGAYEEAITMFDQLDSFGLEKNTESMNLLLDTLCKERRVVRARVFFLNLKSYIEPDDRTFNIFIRGWCNVKRIEEAQWTIQEMKGHGFQPCVISYSTIIQSYCREGNFQNAYELLDEMKAQGYTPNAVTYTTILSALSKSKEFDVVEALQIVERRKETGCKPDTLFCNALIYALGKSGRVSEALDVADVQMLEVGLTPTTSTYNSLISMLCRNSETDKALNVFSSLDSSPYCQPDVQSYHPLLKLCFKTGKADELLSKLLHDMVNRHHISLDLSTYSLLIHGLCRVNKCEMAYDLFKEMIAREIKQKNIHEAEETIEEFIKRMK